MALYFKPWSLRIGAFCFWLLFVAAISGCMLERVCGLFYARKKIMSLYSTKAWQRLRERVLIRDGYQCQICSSLLGSGRGIKGQAIRRSIMPAVIDHIIPHQGDRDLFHDPHNLWALCSICHDSECAAIERRYKGARIALAKRDYRLIGMDGLRVKQLSDRHIDSAEWENWIRGRSKV